MINYIIFGKRSFLEVVKVTDLSSSLYGGGQNWHCYVINIVKIPRFDKTVDKHVTVIAMKGVIVVVSIQPI